MYNLLRLCTILLGSAKVGFINPKLCNYLNMRYKIAYVFDVYDWSSQSTPIGSATTGSLNLNVDSHSQRE